MLGDLFKIFVEQPEKLTKVGLRVINTIFILIISEWLYRYFFGNYTLMKLSEYQDWVNFILSGRLLLTIACFLITKYFLEPIPATILYFVVVQWLSKLKKLKIKQKNLKDWMETLDIVKYNSENKIPQPGENIDILYGIAHDFRSAEEVEGYNELKHSLLKDVLNLYASFFAIYFLFLHTHFYSLVFIGVLSIGFIVFICLYLIMNNLIEFMQTDHEELIDGIDVIKSHHLIAETLAKYFIKPYRSDLRVGKEEFFEYGDRSYAIIFDHGRRPLELKSLQKYIAKLEKINRHLFLIKNKKYEVDGLSRVNGMGNICTFIFFENYADLKEQLDDKLVRKILDFNT